MPLNVLPATGTSPLTRGKPASSRLIPPTRRNIPAHAGKTLCPRVTFDPIAEHPRSRGENHQTQTRHCTHYGTSPLTRGKQTKQLATLVDNRNIPAHAGKTTSRTVFSRRMREHPRSRGENKRTMSNEALHLGTSPLTRGKLTSAIAGATPGRNIPAHAGKTPRSAE